MSRKLPEDQKKKYTPLNLPTDLVEDIKAWREANIAYGGNDITNEKLIRHMLDLYIRNMRKYHNKISLFAFRKILERKKPIQ